MIGKTITGRSFGGCVSYVVDKIEAVILDASGVRMQNTAAITQDFNLQRKSRPGLGKAVGHLILSWSKEDLPKLNSAIMVERAKEYMEKMNICNTQFVIVRHNDRENPHIHIIYNRVDNKGITIPDNNNYAINIKVCKEMTLKYGYHLGKDKEQVNRQALTGKEKLRHELYDAIKLSVKQSVNWKSFESNLQAKGVQIEYKFRNGTNEVQGISFEKNGFKMKGSAVDRAFSYGSLNTRLQQNSQVGQQHTSLQTVNPTLADQLKEVLKTDNHHGTGHAFDGVKNFLEALLSPEFVPVCPDPAGDDYKRRKKKKKYEQEQSNGLSR